MIELTNEHSFTIKDDFKLDFFYVIKGDCKLEFEVERFFNTKTNEETSIILTEEELECKKDI